MRTGDHKLVIVSGSILLVSLIILGTAFYFFFTFRITKNPIIKNESLLRQYLGVSSVFSKPINGIHLLVFSPQNTWKQTDDCIGSRISPGNVFCFDETIKSGVDTINIYPNSDVVAQTDPTEVTRLLNFNLMTILEKQFGISQDKRTIVLGEDGNGAMFIWQ